MNKVAIAMLASILLLLTPASTAVEESAVFNVGDTWALGHEFDIMEELDSFTKEILEELDAEIENNPTGEYGDLMGYSLNENEGVIGVYYTSEVVDDFDEQIHIKSEEAFYIHTAIDTSITAVFFQEGTYNDVEKRCVDEGDECTYTLPDDTEIPTETQTMEIGGNFHYVTKVITETWWTQDNFDMTKMELTLGMGMSGGMKLQNVPNETWELKMKEVDYDDDGYPDAEEEDCEYEDGEETCHFEYVNTVMETAVLDAAAEASFHLVFEFDRDPLNALDLPLEANEYWEGETEVTVSGDAGVMIDIEKPVLSICPDLDCDQLPEVQELYEGLTMGIEELHENETFSITVDRDGDGLPDVIDAWDDIFPMYVPENWMDDAFQAILEAISCEDDDSAQEGEECDERAEEEFEKLDLRIEDNRFAFGPYDIPVTIPYAFETSDQKSAQTDDGTPYTGYQIIPSEPTSDEEDDEGDDDRDDGEGGDLDDPTDDGRAGEEDESDDEFDDEGECGGPLCESELIWFHNAETGQPAFMQMDMPNAKEDGYSVTIAPIAAEQAEQKIDANADPDNPEKNNVLSSSNVEASDDGILGLPGFGLMAAAGSLMLAGRRFRK